MIAVRMTHKAVIDKLIESVTHLSFAPPVSHVYNPLKYARKAYDTYLRKFGSGRKEIIFLGMNPGPWGMTQTGIPFGEVRAVTEWLGIRKGVHPPQKMHPKRPINGFECRRSEVSGKRLWGWAKNRFDTPAVFFNRFFVANYCPLVFMEAGGKNKTPDSLPLTERKPLLEACDLALQETVAIMRPAYVVGVGNFAAQQAARALAEMDVTLAKITHPSPANPKANKGWETAIEKELADQGILDF